MADTQRLPRLQPVQPDPYGGIVDIGGWSIEDFVAREQAAAVKRASERQAIQNYIAAQGKAGTEVAALNPYTPGSYLDQINYDVYNAYNPVNLANPAASTGEVFRFDPTGDNPDSAPVVFRPGDTYVLTDADGKNVISVASSPEEMRALVKAADSQPFWNLYAGDAEGNFAPGSQLFNKSDTRADGLMGALVNYGLPLALSFVPGLGQVGSALLTGAGSTAGRLMTGSTLDQALKSGLITAATAGILKGTGLDQTIGNAIGKVPGVGDVLQGIGGTFAPSAAQAVGNEIVVNAATSAANNLAAPIISGITSGIGSIPAGQFQPTELPSVIEQAPPMDEPITVTGNRVNDIVGIYQANPNISIMSPLLSGYTPAEISEASKIYQDGQPIEVVAPRPTPPLPVYVPPSGGAPEYVDTNDIVVESERPGGPATVVPSGAGGSLAPDNTITKPIEQPDLEQGGLSLLDKIRLGLLGVNLAGDIFGGEGGGTLPVDNSAVQYNPLNRQQTIRGVGADPFNVFTYGQDLPGAQSGEFMFFQPAAAPAVKLKEGGEADDDMVKHLVEYSSGRGHMGPGQVKGIGSGQEDLIPAWLSDGEYVWSAQDVADLGDGSTDEGVRRLDEMRQMVRKQAGRKETKKIAKPQRGIDHMLKAVGGAA